MIDIIQKTEYQTSPFPASQTLPLPVSQIPIKDPTEIEIDTKDLSFLFQRKPSPRNSSWPPYNRSYHRRENISDQIASLINELSVDNSDIDVIQTRRRSASQDMTHATDKKISETLDIPCRERYGYTYEFGNNASEIIKSLYNPIERCKSSGIIPYTIHKGKLMFLFQKLNDPIRKKDSGWNDFGGKRIIYFDRDKEIYTIEESVRTAAREFSEETSCLFYANDHKLHTNYEMLRDRPELDYGEKEVSTLIEMIPKSTNYHADKINEIVIPLYISSKETYISYLLRVNYLPASDLPRAEDIHIDYADRYLRTCQWFTIDELMELPETAFHKRLQITRIQQRIASYHNMDHFIDKKF
jgi:hypothetical protein